MSNNRVFYACQAVAICKMGHVPSGGASANVAFIKGVQSVGISTNFSLDQAFELGQVEIYQNSEEVADLEVTLEKVIDGEKLMYLSAAGNTATESLTLVGNDKFFDTSGAGVVLSPSGAWGNSTDTGLSGTDTPASGLIRRTDIDLTNSTLPAEAVSQGSASSRHINSINVSADFGRDQIMELGRFGPYYRYATFPFEISSEFEVTATQTDEVAISGTHPNLVDRTIKIQDNAGTVVDLGTKNKLSSVSYSGGDTGGGNVTITYSYSTFNVFTVQGGGTYW